MGMGLEQIDFLFRVRHAENGSIKPFGGGCNFRQVITLGRQYCFSSAEEIVRLSKLYDKAFTSEKARLLQSELAATTNNAAGAQYSEPVFKYLGAEVVDSIDISGYENATVIHDLQRTIPENLKNKYSFVLDGGLLEHVFNVPAALRNAMDMVEIGGHLALITPANNWFGHGMWQLQPELFFSVLRPENGFTDTHIYSHINGAWYEHKNPRELGFRPELKAFSYERKEHQIYVVSRKTAETPAALTAFQSDYEIAWEKGKDGASGGELGTTAAPAKPSALKKVYLALPVPLRNFAKFVTRNGHRKYKKEMKSYFIKI